MFTHPAYENDYLADENEFELPNIAEMLHQYTEESITDEQVQRILKPIFEKIDAGEFKKTQTPKPTMTQDELIRQSYKFQLASTPPLEASLDIIWKGAELHIRIEYK